MKKPLLIAGYGILSVMMMTSVYCQPDNNGDFTISDFENFSLEPDTFRNGADLNGSFKSGLAVFRNNYDATYGSWTGWSYSNMADDTTAGYANQYSAITASGVEPVVSEGSTYSVGYIPVDFISMQTLPVAVRFTGNTAHEVEGLYVTNSTYAALSMEQGDDFAKKFGGESGDDPDWFMLSVWGLKGSTETDTIDYFLADYRFDNNAEDYIIKSWEWIDLSSLGKVDSLMFLLNSSDVGDFGMNTPGYFCIDNLYIAPDDPSVIKEYEGSLSVSVFPNPVKSRFRIDTPGRDILQVSMYSITGELIYTRPEYISGQNIDISHFSAGNYILRVQKGQINSVHLIIKQ